MKKLKKSKAECEIEYRSQLKSLRSNIINRASSIIDMVCSGKVQIDTGKDDNDDDLMDMECEHSNPEIECSKFMSELYAVTHKA